MFRPFFVFKAFILNQINLFVFLKNNKKNFQAIYNEQRSLY